MSEITVLNYLRHALLLPRGQFMLGAHSALSFLMANPEADHRPLSSCLVYVVYGREFLGFFFSWQHLENNV